MTKTPQPRIPPGRLATAGALPGPDARYRDVARSVAAQGRDLVDAIERALREAHRAGFSEGSASNVPESEAALLADVATAMAEGGDLGFEQPLGPCPGMPWHMTLSGRAVLDGEFAALFPDVAVQGLAARGGLVVDGASASPGPRLADLLPELPGRAPR